jgi:hypothetical protein
VSIKKRTNCNSVIKIPRTEIEFSNFESRVTDFWQLLHTSVQNYSLTLSLRFQRLTVKGIIKGANGRDITALYQLYNLFTKMKPSKWLFSEFPYPIRFIFSLDTYFQCSSSHNSCRSLLLNTCLFVRFTK